MRLWHRRGVLAGLLAFAAIPAQARERYRIENVTVRLSDIVASRVRSDIGGRIAHALRGRGNGRPVDVAIELRTIDPYRPTQTFSIGRSIAVRYSVVDRATGQVIARSRFIETTEPRENDIGTVRFNTRVITRGTQERELAREVASRIARDLR